MFQEFPEDNKGDDFLNEFRQKIADQSSNNIEERRNEMKRSKSVFIGAVSGVALAGGLFWLRSIQIPETLKFRLYADRRQRLKFSRANPAEWKFSIRTKASMTL